MKMRSSLRSSVHALTFLAGLAGCGASQSSLRQSSDPAECTRQCSKIPGQTLVGMRACVERCMRGEGAATPQSPASSPLTVTAPALVPSQASEALNADRLRSRVLELVNEERAVEDLPPLRYNPQLTQAAQGHAEYMLRTGDFAHETKTGSSVADRARAAGYAFSYLGENIGWDYPSPEAAMEGWMDSSGHRENILRPEYNEMGVGAACDAGHSNCYWVQVFGRSSPSRSPDDDRTALADGHETFVDCLNARGVAFYHTTWCGACAAQRALLTRVLGKSQMDRLNIVFGDKENAGDLPGRIAENGSISLPSVYIPPVTVVRGNQPNIVHLLSDLTGCSLP